MESGCMIDLASYDCEVQMMPIRFSWRYATRSNSPPTCGDRKSNRNASPNAMQKTALRPRRTHCRNQTLSKPKQEQNVPYCPAKCTRRGISEKEYYESSEDETLASQSFR
ncbi:unnamed protein product [Sphacelaria rigidula]